MRDLYSLFTSEPLHSLHLEIFKVLQSCFIQYLSCNDVLSHPPRPTRKRKKLKSLKVSLLEARNGILARLEEKYALSRLHINFSEKEELAQLLSEDDLQAMLDGRDYNVADTVFLYVASFTDKSIGF